MTALTGIPALDKRSKEIHLDTAPGRTSVFFSAADLMGLHIPQRPWLIDGVVPSGTVTLLGGDGGTGKSLAALQLATSTALSRPWLGLSVEPGNALYISAEDDRDEIHRRLADICHAEGVALSDLGKLTIRSLAGEDALLAVQESHAGGLKASSLYRELDARLTADTPALVVLDTLADLFPGNENDRAQARQFIGLLRGLAIRHKSAVVVLAHPSLSGLNSGSGTSGSTGWNNSVRSRLYLERVIQDGYEADPDARILSTKKSNYGRIGGEIAMRWREGVFVADAPVTGLDRLAATAKAERVFLKLLDLFNGQGRNVNSKGGPNYAPKVFSMHPESEGVSKRALGQAMEKLLTDGKVVIGTEGPPSRRVSFIARGD